MQFRDFSLGPRWDGCTACLTRSYPKRKTEKVKRYWKRAPCLTWDWLRRRYHGYTRHNLGSLPSRKPTALMSLKSEYWAL